MNVNTYPWSVCSPVIQEPVIQSEWEGPPVLHTEVPPGSTKTQRCKQVSVTDNKRHQFSWKTHSLWAWPLWKQSRWHKLTQRIQSAKVRGTVWLHCLDQWYLHTCLRYLSSLCTMKCGTFFFFLQRDHTKAIWRDRDPFLHCSSWAPTVFRFTKRSISNVDFF